MQHVAGMVVNGEKLLTKEELRVRLNLHSTRGVDQLTKDRKIRKIVLGHRTVRFSLPHVLADLEKLTVRSVE
jgi:hypothetical protein